MRELIDRLGYQPRNCVWELTRACNLSCAHCGSAAGRPRDHELSTGRCLDLVAELAALGNRLITLSGGEPTVRADWPVIARAAVDAGIKVNMVTNGQSDARQLADHIAEAGLENVGVSVDGLEPTHDAIRKPGAFARAIETVRVLAGRGIWVNVMMTVNRLNLAELEAVYRLAGKLGARGFRTQLSKPMGNQTERDDLTLAPHHLLSLLPRLARLARAPGPQVDVGDSIGYFSAHEQVLRGHRCAQGHWTGCYAGCRAIGIQADGSIKGCLSLQPRAGEADPFIEGSVRDDTLADIWHRPGAFAYNRQFTRDQLTGACAECAYGEICRGGATCVAHSYTGQMGCDPMCYYHAALAHREDRRASWVQAASATAAAIALSVGGPGCSGEAIISSPAKQDAGSDAATDGSADAQPDGPDLCAEAECTFMCPDYGMGECYPTEPIDVFQACCCEEVCCDCEYGNPIPPEQLALCCEPFNGDDYGVDPP